MWGRRPGRPGELTIRSRGPAIRAEAAADDRYAALDLAFAKLESRLRRAADRRKVKDTVSVRSPGVLTDEESVAGSTPLAPAPAPASAPTPVTSAVNGEHRAEPESGLIPI